MMLAFLAMLGSTCALAFYLLSLRGLSVVTTGLLMLPLALAQLALSAQTPRLTARFGARTTGTFGMLDLTAALAPFITLDANSPWWIVETALLLIGVGIAFVMPSASAAVMMSVPTEHEGSASATSNTFRQVGGALGNAMLGGVLTTAYRAEVDGHLVSLPVGVRETAAAGSIQATHAALYTLGLSGPDRASLITASNDAFIAGFDSSALVGAAVAFIGAIVAATGLTNR